MAWVVGRSEKKKKGEWKAGSRYYNGMWIGRDRDGKKGECG